MCDSREIKAAMALMTDEFVAGEAVGQNTGFLGAMDYPPNVEATQRLFAQIFLPLKKKYSRLQLRIIGRSPTESIRKLAAEDVVVTGTVDNIWSEHSKVSVFVFPMVSGAGLQNKILESMYAEGPVVTTQFCNDSLAAENGVEVFCGETNQH